MRFNAGKMDPSLIPLDARVELMRVYHIGAQKYDRDNWLKGMNWSTMVDCAERHFMLWQMGLHRDPDTGCHHLALAAWNLLGLLVYELRGLGTDDRTKLPIDEKFDWTEGPAKDLGLGLSQSEIDAMREKYSKLREMKKAVDNITKEPEKPKVSGILYNTSGILQYTNNKWYLDEPDTLTELLDDDVIHVFNKTDMKKAEKISKKDLNDSHNKAHATLMRVCQPFDLFHINITLLNWGYNILYIDQKTKTELMTRYTEEALEFAKKHNIKVDIEKAKKNLDIFFNKKA